MREGGPLWSGGEKRNVGRVCFHFGNNGHGNGGVGGVKEKGVRVLLSLALLKCLGNREEVGNAVSSVVVINTRTWFARFAKNIQPIGYAIVF